MEYSGVLGYIGSGVGIGTILSFLIYFIVSSVKYSKCTNTPLDQSCVQSKSIFMNVMFLLFIALLFIGLYFSVSNLTVNHKTSIIIICIISLLSLIWGIIIVAANHNKCTQGNETSPTCTNYTSAGQDLLGSVMIILASIFLISSVGYLGHWISQIPLRKIHTG